MSTQVLCTGKQSSTECNNSIEFELKSMVDDNRTRRRCLTEKLWGSELNYDNEIIIKHKKLL